MSDNALTVVVAVVAVAAAPLALRFVAEAGMWVERRLRR